MSVCQHCGRPAFVLLTLRNSPTQRKVVVNAESIVKATDGERDGSEVVIDGRADVLGVTQTATELYDKLGGMDDE